MIVSPVKELANVLDFRCLWKKGKSRQCRCSISGLKSDRPDKYRLINVNKSSTQGYINKQAKNGAENMPFEKRSRAISAINAPNPYEPASPINIRPDRTLNIVKILQLVSIIA